MEKIDNFVSNCSRYMVQSFVLEVLMSSFENIHILENYDPEGVFATPPGEGGGKYALGMVNFQDGYLSKELISTSKTNG